MGQGGEVRGHQGRVIGATPAQIFRNARFRELGRSEGRECQLAAQRAEFRWMRASSSSAPRAHAAKTGCEQRIALRDHIVEGHPTIGSDYVAFVERAPQRLLTCRRCLGRCYRSATVTFVLSEFAMKQFSCAAWCIVSSSSALGLRLPLQVIFGRSSTRVIASLPSAFFSIWPTASSSYESSTNFCLQAIDRNVSM